MARPEYFPEGIATGEDSLVIDWNDGHQTSIAADRLRGACPCALCREERADTSPLAVRREIPPSGYRIQRLEWVGRYAVSIVWGDGHSTGIYTWTVLRDLCDCFQCRLERGEVSGGDSG